MVIEYHRFHRDNRRVVGIFCILSLCDRAQASPMDKCVIAKFEAFSFLNMHNQGDITVVHVIKLWSFTLSLS